MIYTVTLNPAVDYIMRAESISFGATNRSYSEALYIGGKGINVSRILNELGVTSTVLGFAAGFTGELIKDFLEKEGISSELVFLKEGFSRINVKLKADTETEINGKGPDISPDDEKALFEKLEKIQKGDTVILAGSIPSSCDKDIYERMAKTLCEKGIRFAVDATKESLQSTLKYRPFVIKPNIDELCEFFGETQKNDIDVEKYAHILQNEGAQNVIVSMGKDGALLLDENGKLHRVKAHSGKVKNTVGAGDSMLAGYIAGYEKTADHAYAIMLGNAAGAATAFSDDLAKGDMIMKMME